MGNEKDKPGLGKVIYSVDDKPAETPEDKEAVQDAQADVEEADKESFPASDPPGFAGAAIKDDNSR